MRRPRPDQLRLDCTPVTRVELNFGCRHEIVPLLKALQHIYSQPKVCDQVLALVGNDLNETSSPNKGRGGFDYWTVMVLAAVHLGCNLDYDALQDLAENHRTLRQIMGIGDWEEDVSFDWRRIRDNVCRIKPATIKAIYSLIVGEGHRLEPKAVAKQRGDSFVMETNIHYPTESSLLFDGVRVLTRIGSEVATKLRLSGWRQHRHQRKKAKRLHREISGLSVRKTEEAREKMRELYVELLTTTRKVTERTAELLETASSEDLAIIGKLEKLREFLGRTRQVASCAYRRVVHGEKVPREEKLFSMFEPHTQLYRRGKAGKDNQWGRLVLIFEDSCGFITHHHIYDRFETDADAAFEQTCTLQELMNGKVESVSFDRAFYSPENQEQLPKVVDNVCLPKLGVRKYTEQMQNVNQEFLEARQRHPGIESKVGVLQAGNGAARCRDRGETAFARYLALAILGQNLHVLGKLLIQRQASDSLAAESRRKHAA